MSKPSKHSRTTRLALSPLEDRSVPAAAAGPYAVGVATGHTGDVVVYAADGTQEYTVVNPYGANFTGGVRVALADVTGDGTPDLITAPGAGTAPTIDVFDGASPTHALYTSFDAYESTFTGGVYVAAADITGDGKAEIVTGADQSGGPRVIVFSGASVAAKDSSPTKLDDFLAIDDPNFRGGVRLALGDVNGDGTADLVVGAGFGGGPRVAVFDGASLAGGQQVRLMNDFFAYEQTLRNGVFPAVGDLNHDGFGDLIFGAGPGGAPRVRALNGRAALAGQEDALADFFAGNAGSRLGVQVGTVTGPDGTTEIAGTDLATNGVGFFGPDGKGHGGPHGPGGPVCGAPPGEGGPGTGTGSPTPIPVSADTATAVQGTYTGSGTGALLTFTSPRALPTVTMPSASVTLNITGATLDAPRPGSTDTDSYSLTITGTLTVAIDGQGPVTVAVRGRFRLTVAPDASGTLQGQLHLGNDLTANATPGLPATAVALDATLDGSTLTVDQLTVTPRPTQSGGYSFRSPGSLNGDEMTLTKA